MKDQGKKSTGLGHSAMVHTPVVPHLYDIGQVFQLLQVSVSPSAKWE